jgi:hypothetical protein
MVPSVGYGPARKSKTTATVCFLMERSKSEHIVGFISSDSYYPPNLTWTTYADDVYA